ncbi:MAG: DUF4468 domain-containing protein [Chitinophagales bacterium]
MKSDKLQNTIISTFSPFGTRFSQRIFWCFCLLLAGLTVNAQKEKPVAPDLPRNDENNQVYYMEVISMDEIDKTELFKRSQNWMKEYYKNPTGFLETADSVNGSLVMKPQFATYRILKNGVKAQSALVKYTLVVGFKDGRYRYEIKDVNLKAASYEPIEKLFNESDPNIEDNYNTLNEANKSFLELINNLKESMKEPSVKVKKDEW